ncbi:lysophospholipid acyltransferase family protein [Geotalea sp. SG265]|uniref:lysophospholipid acyltransferase family protein n=1 Tax=Geotalea sp. SG265 TaxID=2922867 RepID=UPI001FAFCF67|nr:lysophospholipid acyltransferase family protein [Geotalea sp. SG265]
MLRAYLYLSFFVPFTLLCSITAIVGTFFDAGGAFAHRCSRFWSRWGLRLAGIPVAVEGLEHIPGDGPVIFMGNHQGNFDILALSLAIPRRFSWIAKKELFAVPMFGEAMRRAGYIPLDRSDGRRALKSMNDAAARIRNGSSVVIFPEGTRTKDGSLLPFKRGGFLLAAKAGVPIVPFTINGSMRINPRNRIELYPGTLRIAFAPPVATAAGGDKDQLKLMEQVRSAIAAGLE